METFGVEALEEDPEGVLSDLLDSEGFSTKLVNETRGDEVAELFAVVGATILFEEEEESRTFNIEDME